MTLFLKLQYLQISSTVLCFFRSTIPEKSVLSDLFDDSDHGNVPTMSFMSIYISDSKSSFGQCSVEFLVNPCSK